MRPTAQHREILRYLREDYGVADAALANGTNHPRVEFTHAGERRTLIVHGPGDNHRSLGGNNLVNMKKQDVRRLLGPPPERAIADNKRRLEDMMPPFNSPRIVSSTSPVEPARDVYHGHAAVYSNGQMRFFLPANLAGMLPDGVRVEPFGDDAWKLSTDHAAGPRVGLKYARAGERALNAARDMETPEPFGISPTEYSVVDGEILAYVPLATRRALKAVRHNPARRSAPSSIELKSDNALVGASIPPSLDQMRECLAIIRRVEADTSFRLVRGKESGVWRFVASVE